MSGVRGESEQDAVRPDDGLDASDSQTKEGQPPRSDAPPHPEKTAQALYSPQRFLPKDFAISLKAKGGSDVLLANDQGPRRQPMAGFDDAYVDIIDYIVRITHRIWEQKDIGYIYDTYRHNARVTDDSGLQYGRDKIVADTVHTINAFPDIRLYADEIVWAGDDKSGYHTSHRTVIVGHNTGYSRWGAPTGRKVVVWCIADCASISNEIYEEWVLYNNSSLLAQLGFDLRALAREVGNQRDWSALADRAVGEIERLAGQGKPAHLAPTAEGASFDPEDFVKRLGHYAWNWRNLSTIDSHYAPGVRWHGPTGRELYGRGDLKSFLLSMLAMFPDLAYQLDDFYCMGNEQEGYLTSARWSMQGTHRGHGVYGPPTGRRVLIWGISQHRIVGQQIVEEWTVFNEFEVMQQLYRDQPVLDGQVTA